MVKKHSLQSYMTAVAGWSEDTISLNDFENAHVVFENGFIESFKDALFPSNKEGKQAHVQHLQGAMDVVLNAFISEAQAKPEQYISINQTDWFRSLGRRQHFLAPISGT